LLGRWHSGCDLLIVISGAWHRSGRLVDVLLHEHRMRSIHDVHFPVLATSNLDS
jgi:hypothetical protein